MEEDEIGLCDGDGGDSGGGDGVWRDSADCIELNHFVTNGTTLYAQRSSHSMLNVFYPPHRRIMVYMNAFSIWLDAICNLFLSHSLSSSVSYSFHSVALAYDSSTIRMR